MFCRLVSFHRNKLLQSVYTQIQHNKKLNIFHYSSKVKHNFDINSKEDDELWERILEIEKEKEKPKKKVEMDPVEKSFLYKDRAFRFVGEYNPVHEQLKGAFELAKLFADDEDFDFTKKVDEKYDPKLCVPGGTTMIDGDTRQWNTIHEIAVEEHPEGYKSLFSWN